MTRTNQPTQVKADNGAPIEVVMPHTEAANNQTVKNMAPKVGNQDISDFRKQQVAFYREMNANNIELSAEVRAKEIRKGKEITDKATGQIVIDEFTNEPKRYPDTYIVTLLFKGGSLDYKCSEDMYAFLDIGSTYKFNGYLGAVKEFGKDVISPILQSYTFLM